MPRRTPPASTKQPTPSEQIRALGVVIEDMSSKMNVVVEAVTSMPGRWQADMSAMESRLSARIEVLESVVRQNSADIKQNSADIRQNSADIIALREQVAGLRHDFDHREELGRVSALETRVSAIESRLGIARR